MFTDVDIINSLYQHLVTDVEIAESYYQHLNTNVGKINS